MNNQKPFRVVLIGPECTGKTQLTGILAGHYGVPWSPEYARLYVEKNFRSLEYTDVDAIGRGQMIGEDQVLARAREAKAAMVIFDTDLVSTMVYSRHYYGDCPQWLSRVAGERLGDLYLLHHVDLEWVADGYQREQPERRLELFTLFRKTLLKLGAYTIDVEGELGERRRRAIAAIDEFYIC